MTIEELFKKHWVKTYASLAYHGLMAHLVYENGEFICRPVETMEELEGLTEAELLRLPQVGRKTVEYIHEVIRRERQARAAFAASVLCVEPWY